MEKLPFILSVFGLGPVFCSCELITLALEMSVFVLTGLPITARVYGGVASAVTCSHLSVPMPSS